MKSLIIVYSYHHNNTLKIADEIADVMGSIIKTPMEISQEELIDYDLIGFGAGIDSGRHYKELLDFAENLKEINGKKCFVFSTSAVQGEGKVKKDHAKLIKILKSKGYDVLGEFSCKGFNTNSVLKYIGGMNKQHPNNVDIKNAREFALKIMESSNI